MNPKWSSKFELKPGKWVFVPTPEAVTTGKKIKKTIEKCWRPPAYFFHLRVGGHVEALRSHLNHDNFLRVDIKDFFGSISRTRVTRCLGSTCSQRGAHYGTLALGLWLLFPFPKDGQPVRLCTPATHSAARAIGPALQTAMVKLQSLVRR